jgi:hypothetical protein
MWVEAIGHQKNKLYVSDSLSGFAIRSEVLGADAMSAQTRRGEQENVKNARIGALSRRREF